MSILEVNNVSIRYMTGDFKDIGLKEYVMRRLKNDYKVVEFWADKDVTFEWKSQPAEVVAMFQEGTATVAMLPQPFVTVASTQVEGLRVAINLNEAWEALDNGSALITGVLVGRREFVEAHPEVVAGFLARYEESIAFANENVEEAAALVEEYGIVKAAVAKKALPYCNITFVAGEDMRAQLSGYLAELHAQDPASVGGSVPDDAFYFVK